MEIGGWGQPSLALSSSTSVTGDSISLVTTSVCVKTTANGMDTFQFVNVSVEAMC